MSRIAQHRRTLDRGPCRHGPAWRCLILRAVVAGGVALLVSCHSTPNEIWIPGESFSQTLEIEPVSTEVRAGEWLELDANRRTGPWVRVARPEEHPDGNCWWRRPPPPDEPNVGANVRWFAEPAGEFNLPGPDDGFKRRVRFGQPGTYTLRAQSAGCPLPFDSDPVTITVLP